MGKRLDGLYQQKVQAARSIARMRGLLADTGQPCKMRCAFIIAIWRLRDKASISSLTSQGLRYG